MMSASSPSPLPVADADFAQVKALFNAICDLPDAAARMARLAESGAPAHVQHRVLALVGRDSGHTTRFSKPVAGMLASVTGVQLKPGDTLGAWRLISELGHGGMGTVFLAERNDGHYQQRAAIKLLRGWSGEAALAQLARERQILASLNHPNIARLIDGGSTPAGQPYLVMEYVDGQRIDVYIHEHGLGLQEALDLFVMVCEAVAYAHRQLVVHCDIKPGNVLVGADGRALLLDFGIAQLQDPKADAPNAADVPVAMTPRYASPEQRAGSAAGSASDIYSLGIMLGEMLATQGPLARRPQEWQAIVRRATEVEPEARYPTVDALVSDLRRYRLHLPLAALPRTGGYIARKLLRRRWPWLLAGSAALVLSAGFTWRVVLARDRALQAEADAAQSALQARQSAALAAAAERQALQERDQAAQARAQAQRERDGALAAEAHAAAAGRQAEAARRQALQEVATTRQVSDFMVSLFEGADPRVSGRADLSAASLVDKGRERLDRDLQTQPALQASMKGVLAKVYENIGRPRTAAELYEQAIALERAKPQPEPLREAALLSRLAVTWSNDNQEARAVAPARRALALRQARLPADALDLADSFSTLGLVLSRVEALGEARAHLEQALAIRLKQQGPEHPDVAVALQNLGGLTRREGRLADAEALFRRAHALKMRVLGEQNPSTLTSLESLGGVLAAQHRGEEALVVQRQALAHRRTVHGPQSTLVAKGLNELASTLQDAGRSAEAITLYHEAITLGEQMSGRGSTAVALNINNLATALDDLGDPAAEDRYRESLAIRTRLLQGDDLSLARARHNLGRWLLRAGRPDEALPLLTQAAASRRQRLAAGHSESVDTELVLVEWALLSDADWPAAEAGLARLSAREASLKAMHRVALWRAQGLLASRRQAAELALEKHQAALALARSTVGEAHPALLRLRVELGEAALAARRPEVLRLLLPALRAATQEQHPASLLRARGERLLRTEIGENPGS